MDDRLRDTGQLDGALTVGVLGPFQAQVDGEWRPAPTRQVGRVATILAGWPGEYVDRDTIITGLWGDDTPATVNNTLQVHVSHLRGLLGKDAVRSRGSAYALDVAPEAVDAERFARQVQDAMQRRRKDEVADAAALLTDALALWRGLPFPDVQDPDLAARRARLEEVRDQAREDLLECRFDLCQDRYELADVIAGARELVSRQPVRERGHVLLVRALGAAGRAGEASEAFSFAADQLRRTTGLTPGPELVDARDRATRHDQTLLPRAMRSSGA